MLWLTKFFTKGKSLKDGIKYFHTLNGRMPNNMETIKIKNAFMEQNRPSNVIDITSRIKDDWWKQRSGFKRQHPEVTKKVDEDTYSALLERQEKEALKIDPNKPGMGFYSEMSDLRAKHSLERLEFEYDEMFNKILEKAKRIDRDPKVLLEAELGKKLTGEETTTQLLDLFKNRPKKASGGIARTGYFAAGTVGKEIGKALIGKFSKSEVLIKMMENTLKGSKSSYVKKTFPNFIKELKENPGLANDPNVWKQFTTGLPKNQRLIVHSDDSVDFFTQSEFGPHNIEKTLEFQKKHNLSREQANTILRMEPEDRVLEMKRLETIADRSRTKQAAGGIAGELHLNEGGRARFQDGLSADYGLTGLQDPFQPLEDRGLQSRYLRDIMGGKTYQNFDPADVYSNWLNINKQIDPWRWQVAPTAEQGPGHYVADVDPYSKDFNIQDYIDRYSKLVVPGGQMQPQTLNIKYNPQTGELARVKELSDYHKWAKEQYGPASGGAGSLPSGATWEYFSGIEAKPDELQEWNPLGAYTGPPSNPKDTRKMLLKDVVYGPGTNVPGTPIVPTAAQAAPTVEQTAAMEDIQARGIDPRMARSYQENIQLMGDPRMRGAKGGLAKILGV